MNRIMDYYNLSILIQEWIKDYVKSNNIDTLVVGVSGGIDSAVVSTLCARTGLPTIVVGIPLNSAPKNTELSEKHMTDLCSKFKKNVISINVDLSKTFEEFKSHPIFQEVYNSELGFANSKSRLRMMTLYQIASSTNGIVVGTGNKVEDFGVGFYTKYGDGGVDISPIADLYKTEVKNLGIHLGVSHEIVDAEPTDGLWDDNRNDEKQIGATYEELEWVMEYGINKSSYSDKESKIIAIFTNLNKKNKHKMVSIPFFSLKNKEII
jgi:NAD+ synthase